jgi:hypothetical protein
MPTRTNLVYLEAGKIVLVRYQADGTLDLTDASKFIGGGNTVESIKSSIEIPTSELADGNSDFPMGIYDTGKDGTIEVKLSGYSTVLHAALMGVDIESEASKNMWAAEEPHSVPASGAYTYDLDNMVATGGTIVVLDNTGSPFVSVASGPAAGQFTVSGATVTHNSVDAGKEVFVTYEHTALTSERLALPTTRGSRPSLCAIISTNAKSDDETQTFPVNIIVDKCKSSGALSPPPYQKTPEGWTVTLKVLKPRAGYNPVYYRYKLS